MLTERGCILSWFLSFAQGVEMLAQIGQQLLQVLGSTHLSVGDADFAIGLAMHLAGCDSHPLARAFSDSERRRMHSTVG